MQGPILDNYLKNWRCLENRQNGRWCRKSKHSSCLGIMSIPTLLQKTPSGETSCRSNTRTNQSHVAELSIKRETALHLVLFSLLAIFQKYARLHRCLGHFAEKTSNCILAPRELFALWTFILEGVRRNVNQPWSSLARSAFHNPPLFGQKNTHETMKVTLPTEGARKRTKTRCA